MHIQATQSPTARTRAAVSHHHPLVRYVCPYKTKHTYAICKQVPSGWQPIGFSAFNSGDEVWIVSCERPPLTADEQGSRQAIPWRFQNPTCFRDDQRQLPPGADA